MNGDKSFESNQLLELSLEAIAESVQELATNSRGDSIALLTLLRKLEHLHQEIRDSLFQESLPDNRQALYRLLRNIDASGGWPYIHRMKLQALLASVEPSLNGDSPSPLSTVHPADNVQGGRNNPVDKI